MAGRRFKVGSNITVQLHDEEFIKVRKSERLDAYFHELGTEWVDKLNAELHAAQEKRHQKVEDGYVYHVNDKGDRLRLYVIAATARAQAHERAHSSILKLMETTKWDMKTRGQIEKAAAKKAAAAKRKAARQSRLDATLAPSERPPHELEG
jgi:hypothetical protein